jgi:hypothetical protein
MDYEGFLKNRIEALHAGGRYRILADLSGAAAGEGNRSQSMRQRGKTR